MNPTANITKRGILKFLDTQTNKEMRVFTQISDPSELNTIGKIACLEFGFNKSINVNPVLVNDMPISSTDKYLEGISCQGNESSIKECKSHLNSKLGNKSYELQIECLCTKITFFCMNSILIKKNLFLS